jgi:hypothetical protein
VFKKKVEIISRLLEWGMENEQLGHPADHLADTWASEQSLPVWSFPQNHNYLRVLNTVTQRN